jgi:hypothetical protein
MLPLPAGADLSCIKLMCDHERENLNAALSQVSRGCAAMPDSANRDHIRLDA